METQVLSLFSPIILIAIGIVLIAIESIFYSFILIWFGFASLIVGVASYLIPFNDGLWQVASISLIAIVLLFLLRTKAMEKFMKPIDEEINDTFLNEDGEGIIQNGKVYFKATYWDIDSSYDLDFEENEKVHVLSASKGKAKIEKINGD